MTKLIPLTQGKAVLVDDRDYERLAEFKWFAVNVDSSGKHWYAKSKALNCYMHRLIVHAPEGMYVDHINGDGLDNRTENLRICTNRQNCMNAKKRMNATSRYKGVHYHSQSKRWRAQIRIDKRKVYLGCFAAERDAAKAYNEAARKHFGEYAALNLIP